MADVSGPGGTDEDPGGDPPLTFDQRKRIEEQAQRTVSARSGLSPQDIERRIEAHIRRMNFKLSEHPLPREHPGADISFFSTAPSDTGRTFPTQDLPENTTPLWASFRNIEDQETTFTGN